MGVLLIPWAAEIFDVHASLADDWLLVLLLAVLPVTVVELSKIIRQVVFGRSEPAPPATPGFRQ